MRKKNFAVDVWEGLKKRNSIYSILLDLAIPLLILILMAAGEFTLKSSLVDLRDVHSIATSARTDINDGTSNIKKFDVQSLIDARRTMHRAILKIFLAFSGTILSIIVISALLKSIIWAMIKNRISLAQLLIPAAIIIAIWLLYGIGVVVSLLYLSLTMIGVVMVGFFVILAYLTSAILVSFDTRNKLKKNVVLLAHVFSHPSAIVTFIISGFISFVLFVTAIAATVKSGSGHAFWGILIILFVLMHISRLILLHITNEVAHVKR